MNHSACRQADYVRLVERHEWRCCDCGAPLVQMTLRGMEVVAPLRRLDRLLHDELPVYGLPSRVLAGDDAKRAGGDRLVRRVPVSAYCPRRGSCGLGQHVGEQQG